MSVIFRCLLLVLCGWLYGCSTDEKKCVCPQAPDYAETFMWYDVPGENGSKKEVDVFYVLPTCVWNWQDKEGTLYHYMDVRDSVQRAAVDGSNFLAYSLFGGCCNFYSPYYRQITMDSWFESSEEIEKRYQLAHVDVVEAFRYYMKYLNQGRPFILAGHSQGAKAVIELLKHTLTQEEYGRLVATYAFGFSISREELAQYPLLKAATGAEDCGVVVCYNSVSRPDACSPLFADNVVCINPVNWRTDGRYAPASENLGSVFFDATGKSDTLFRQVGVRMLPEMHTLLIDGLSDDDYYIPVIDRLFPKGNYHVQELNLYFLNIQENIRERILAFRRINNLIEI